MICPEGYDMSRPGLLEHILLILKARGSIFVYRLCNRDFNVSTENNDSMRRRKLYWKRINTYIRKKSMDLATLL